MANGVVFRRIGGRVVPIRTDRNEKAKGAGAVVTGAGVAVATGAVAANLHRDAAHFENASRKHRLLGHQARAEAAKHDLFSPRARASAAQHFRLAVKNRAESMRHGVAAKNIKRGGFAVSTGLVAAGTDKLLPENVKKHTGARAAIDGTAGVSTALLMRAAYYKTIRMGKTMAGKPGLRTLDALKLAAKRVFSRGTKF